MTNFHFLFFFHSCPQEVCPVLKVRRLLVTLGAGVAGVCNSFHFPVNRNLYQSGCCCVGCASAEFLGVVPDQSGGYVIQ